MSVTYTVTSTAQESSGFAGWFGYLAEDHPTRACDPAWANYLRDVDSTLHEQPGTVTRSVTFRPFFPRQIKLCVYLNNPAGTRALAERVVDIPAGYGMQRSTAYNCSSFSRYSAQDYFWLYPDDPSELDFDHDGAACEDNSGRSPGPQIPAEPAPPLPPAPTRDVGCTDGVDNDGDGPADMADFDCDEDAYYPAGSRCDYVNAGEDSSAGGSHKTGKQKTTSSSQSRPKPVRLVCNKFVGRRGRNVAYRTRRPTRCAVWRANWAHYQALTFIRAHWKFWGQSTVRARITITGNSGYRAHARITAYRLRRDCTGRYRVYTRVKLLRGSAVRRSHVYRPDICPD